MLSALPTELLRLIIDDEKTVWHEDLRNLRLSCKHLCAVASPILFRHIHICLNASAWTSNSDWPCEREQPEKLEQLVQRGLVSSLTHLRFDCAEHYSDDEKGTSSISGLPNNDNYNRDAVSAAFWSSLISLVLSATRLKSVVFHRVSYHIPPEFIHALNSHPALSSITFFLREFWRIPRPLFNIIGFSLRHICYHEDVSPSPPRPPVLAYEESSKEDLVAMIQRNRSTLEEVTTRARKLKLNEVLFVPFYDGSGAVPIASRPYYPSLSRISIRNNTTRNLPLKDWFRTLLAHAPSLAELELYPIPNYGAVPLDRVEPLPTGLHEFLNEENTMLLTGLRRLSIHETSIPPRQHYNWNPLTLREAAKYVFPLLRKLLRLTVIYISFGEMSRELLEALSGSITHCLALKQLNIHWARGRIGMAHRRPLELLEPSPEQVFATLPSLNAHKIPIKCLVVRFSPNVRERYPRGVGFNQERTLLESLLSVHIGQDTLLGVERISIEYPFYDTIWTFTRAKTRGSWVFARDASHRGGHHARTD